jgi:dipeptidyl aminopeptidase/acylaminoacyl peptidase
MKPLNVAEDAPWKLRYRAPSIMMTQVAKLDPERGTAVANDTDIFQVYAWDVPAGTRRQLTFREEGVLMHALSPDGRYIYYLEDKKGDEIGHFVRMPWDGGNPVVVTPSLLPYSPAGLTISRQGNKLALITAMPDGFTLYVLDLLKDDSIGEPQKLFHSQALMMVPLLSPDGSLVVVHTAEKTGRPEYALYAFDTQTGEKVGELWDGEQTSIQGIGFTPRVEDGRLLANSNKTGIEQLLLWHPRSGQRQDLAFADVTGSANAFDWTNDGQQFLFRTFNQAEQQWYVYDVGTENVTALNTPSGTIAGSYFMPDGEIFAHLQDSTHPTQLVALDAQTGKLKREVLAASDVPPGHPWRSVQFTSSDGQQIQGWLGVPEGEGPFPTILYMIGGPMGVQTNSFSAASQAWLDHGFAYLTINYRGCATFGREHQYKIVGDLGHWEVEDIVAAREWLIANKIANPDEIFLNGWSYGGYLTLMGLGKQPDLWAGGMAGIAIADWAIQYEDTADLLRGVQESLFGGTPQTQPERYKTSSPITYAEQVAAPVLIIQGRNDSRTPARPVQIYEEKMKKLGKDIHVHWFETGHMGAFADSKLGIEHMEMMLRFAYRVLG